MPPRASEIYQECIRFPPVKIRKAGKLDQEILRIHANNVRTPLGRTSIEVRGRHSTSRSEDTVGLANDERAAHCPRGPALENAAYSIHCRPRMFCSCHGLSTSSFSGKWKWP